MKKIIVTLLVLVSTVCGAVAQNITVQSAVGANIGNFIKNNLVGGGGVYVYNAKFNNMSGAVRSQYPQIGTFQANGCTTLGMNSGIVITTGNVNVAPGPNDATGESNSVNNYYTDPEIAAHNLVTTEHPANGCATIDFDFVCLSNSMQFTYCFGSEEYNEYVWSTFNDVFVFYLTGPDPVTGEVVTRNIAMIPNTVDSLHPDGIPVSINSVNAGFSTEMGFTVDNCVNGYDCYSMYYQNLDSCNGYGSSCQLDGVQYDGMTSKLVASSEIVPCQSYHMHISVCNVGDNAFDSGVFLEGNSFYSPSAQIGLSQWTVDTIHRSTPLAIPLTLANTEYDQGTIFVNFGGEAVSGVDFLCMSDDGTVVNNGESFTVDNNVRTLTIMPLANANLNNPKSLSVYFSTALCVEYPELLTYDTMLFVLTKDPGETNSIEAVVAGDDGMVVYPNPATTELILRTATAMKYVSIVDASGREVMYTATAQGTTTLRMNIGALQSGAYTVRVVTEDDELVRHVVKQ